MINPSCDTDFTIIPGNNVLNGYKIIAHALGGIENCDYMNITEAMELHYNNGTRIFEVDICLTEDGEWIGLHKIENYNEYTNSNYNTIPSLEELKSKKLLGKYDIRTLEEILIALNYYNDAFLIIDTKFWTWNNISNYEFIQTNFNSIISEIENIDTNLKNRIIPQIYSEDFYNAVNDIGYFKYFLLAWVGRETENFSPLLLVKNSPNIIAISTLMQPDIKTTDLYDIYLNTDALIFYFTLNDEENMQNLLLHGCADGFFSDYIYEDNFNR